MGMADFKVLLKELAERQLSADELTCLQAFLATAAQPGHCCTLIELTRTAPCQM
ncbi:MAG TPA: hypothetical protein VF774_06255 [Pseudoduganella sp.]|jgi:hypothetical protein